MSEWDGSPVSGKQSPGRTRSSEQHLLDIPRTKLASFGDRSFRVMGPRLWNALPIVIKCCGTLSERH